MANRIAPGFAGRVQARIKNPGPGNRSSIDDVSRRILPVAAGFVLLFGGLLVLDNSAQDNPRKNPGAVSETTQITAAETLDQQYVGYALPGARSALLSRDDSVAIAGFYAFMQDNLNGT